MNHSHSKHRLSDARLTIRPHRSRAVMLNAALTVASVTAIASCGFGTYDDTGAAAPGQWWPWVCPDAGAPSADAGCVSTDNDASKGD
jgi:hypothetical protein